jgi:hypothetical protein
LIDGIDIQFSESFPIDGQEMSTHAFGVGLEGRRRVEGRDNRYPAGSEQ